MKLSKTQLDRIILQELYAYGVNASKPSIQKFPKSLEREQLPDSPTPSIEIDNIEELPSAADPTVPESAQISISLSLGEIEEWKHQKKVEKRIKQFQSYWRSMETNVRYSVEMWLRRQLVMRLNADELQQVIANSTAAAKGQSRAKDPNKKPS